MFRMTASITLLPALLVAWLPVTAGPAVIAPTASTEVCRAEWDRSSASRSCDAGIFGRPDLACRVQASCAKTDGGRWENRYTMNYDQVRNLVNCNGRLKVGAC